jgi:hypothetical protein
MQKVDLTFTIHDLMKERNKQLNKRLSQERANIIRETPIEAGKIKSWQAQKITGYGHSKNNVFAGVLRGSKTDKGLYKKFKRKEKNWNDRFAIPISTYNEAVYSRFRLSFEEI